MSSDLPFLLLRASSAVNERINAAVIAAGFPDLRPAHGLAFARVGAAGATVTDLAEHLGITKQSASTMVAGLVEGGYLRRQPHPSDARAHLLTLTQRAVQVTRVAATEASKIHAELVVAQGHDAARTVLEQLASWGDGAPLRPSW